MENFKNNFNFPKDFMSFSFLDISIFELLIITIMILFSLSIRGLVAKFLTKKISYYFYKNNENIINSLAPPLKLLPLLICFVFLSVYFDLNEQLNSFLYKINITLFTIFIFWFLHQSLKPISVYLDKHEELLSEALKIWLLKSIKYLIIFLAFVAVLETWGIKIGPIIAGLGLFGVAVALGAQDLFKNLISGILIIIEKRFKINDTIEIPNYTIGTVEHIGFRSTLIRQFDSSLISIPNKIFSDTSLINYSERKYRRINWTIGLVYNTSTEQLKNICLHIEEFIKKNENFIVNDLYKTFVRVEKFNESSIDILVYTFCKTNDWDTYLKIKENLAFTIKEIVDSHDSSFAFPSHSIYVESNSFK